MKIIVTFFLATICLVLNGQTNTNIAAKPKTNIVAKIVTPDPLAGVRLSIESREKRIENLRTQLNAVKAKEKSLEQRQLLQRRANPSQMMGHGDNDSKKLDAQHRDLEQKIAALELEIFDIKQRYKMDVLKTKK